MTSPPGIGSAFVGPKGVLFIGKATEKARFFRSS